MVENRINLGNALGRERKFSQAIEEFAVALELRPNSAEAHCGMGSALAGEGKSNEAAQHLEHALAIATSEGNSALADYIRKQLILCQSALAQPQPR